MPAHVLAELLKRNPCSTPPAITDANAARANQAGDDNRNVARMALLLAGLPLCVPGETVNRLCAFSMAAITIPPNALLQVSILTCTLPEAWST